MSLTGKEADREQLRVGLIYVKAAVRLWKHEPKAVEKYDEFDKAMLDLARWVDQMRKFLNLRTLKVHRQRLEVGTLRARLGRLKRRFE